MRALRIFKFLNSSLNKWKAVHPAFVKPRFPLRDVVYWLFKLLHSVSFFRTFSVMLQMRLRTSFERCTLILWSFDFLNRRFLLPSFFATFCSFVVPANNESGIKCKFQTSWMCRWRYLPIFSSYIMVSDTNNLRKVLFLCLDSFSYRWVSECRGIMGFLNTVTLIANFYICYWFLKTVTGRFLIEDLHSPFALLSFQLVEHSIEFPLFWKLSCYQRERHSAETSSLIFQRLVENL